MKLYLNNEKTPVELRLLNDILWGLKALCDSSPHDLFIMTLMTSKTQRKNHRPISLQISCEFKAS